jgi:hypothetical protein
MKTRIASARKVVTASAVARLGNPLGTIPSRLLPSMAVVLILATSVAALAAGSGRPLDLVPFGQFMSWAEPKTNTATDVAALEALPAGSRCIGVVWHEERDVREIRARFAGSAKAAGVAVEYWFCTWPPPPPTMPTIEDPLDDPWQGEWVAAHVECAFKDGVNIFTFKPLDTSENRRADHLPGVTYRRTLKMRLLLPADGAKLESLQMSSDSVLKPLALRIEFGCGQKTPALWDGRLEIFNGVLVSASPWNFEKQDRFEPPFSWQHVATTHPKGVVAEVLASAPSPPGSNDITVVTVRGTAATPAGTLPRTFSFSTLDLERGPIYVPDLCAFVTKADDPRHFSPEIGRAHV